MASLFQILVNHFQDLEITSKVIILACKIHRTLRALEATSSAGDDRPSPSTHTSSIYHSITIFLTTQALFSMKFYCSSIIMLSTTVA
jgi:hypothetical protein